MGALIALWFLFGGIFDHSIHCPDVLPEIVTEPVWRPIEDARYIWKPGETLAILVGTTTQIGNKFYIQDGYKTGVSAQNIEHNKRVRECQTLNGYF